MIVAMAPGSEELAKDSPLVGPAGRLLWSMLKRAGIDRADTYILNVISEWPEGKTGNPTAEQLERNWEAFDSAVSAFQGRVALLLGGDAFQRFTGLSGGIQQWGGYCLPAAARGLLSRTREVHTLYKTKTKLHAKGDPRVQKVKETVPPPPFEGLCLPALHPAGVLRTGLATAPILSAQCLRAGRALRGELKPARTSYATVCMLWAPSPELSVDIETGGIENGITRIGMAHAHDAFSHRWDESARNVTRALLSNENTEYIYHNGGFDIPRLDAATCVTVGPIRDTMLGAALLQPDLPKGLNAAAALYLDCERWKHLDEEDPTKYNALDAIRTFELWQVEKQLLDKTGQRRLFDDTIMGGLPTLIRMGTRGVGISEARREDWLATLRTDASAAHAQWDQETGGCNFASPPQLKALFRRLNMDVPFNKDGAETTDKQGLARLASTYPERRPLLELLVRVRTLFKDIETYALVPTGSDGRVHPSFTPAYKDEDELGKGLAGTWRITAKGPNLQNQPERARRMYVPSTGMAFVGADYAQLEARILGWLAGDNQLLSDCDGDIHARNAERLGIDKVRAKNAFYGWGYLAGARTLQSTFAGRGFKLTVAECEELLRGFDAAYPRAAAFRRAALAEAQAQRFVVNPFGLRRYFPHAKFPAPSAMSTLIQSTGAIMMWKILPQLEKALDACQGRLLLSVHDDIMGEVPVGTEHAALDAIREIMEQSFPEVAPGFHVPVTLKSSGTSWGEMHEHARTAHA